jgi:hypothetical protein
VEGGIILENPSFTSKEGRLCACMVFASLATFSRTSIITKSTNQQQTHQSHRTMPPRIPALTAQCLKAPSSVPSYVSCILPFMQARSASILASLSDNPSAYNKRIRRGRGPSSGKGKTSGRGHKGQKQHGKVPVKFQGGQTPQHVVHGVRGFKNL